MELVDWKYPVQFRLVGLSRNACFTYLSILCVQIFNFNLVTRKINIHSKRLSLLFQNEDL